MTFKKLWLGAAALCVSTCMTAPAWAEGSVSGTIGATTDYKFRGISQSDNGGAVNAGVEYGQDGLAIGAWASTIDFPSDPDNNVEIDLYATYTHGFSENTSLTGKAYYYWYPNSGISDASYVEFLAQLDHNFGKFSANLNAAWAPKYSGDTGETYWFGAGVEVPVTDWATISGNAGQQWFADNAAVGLTDYGTVDLGVTLAWQAVSFDVRYVATDVERADCFGGADVCDAKLVATLTLSNTWE